MRPLYLDAVEPHRISVRDGTLTVAKGKSLVQIRLNHPSAHKPALPWRATEPNLA
jgi:hypothetical protein